MTRPTWIFFDLGWTLVDESEAQRRRFAHAAELLAARGLEVPAERLWALCEEAAQAFAPDALFPWALARLGLEPPVVAEIRRAARYDHAHELLFVGVDALLAELSQTFRLGVIANQSAGTADRLHAWGLAQHFSVIAASAELGFAKPDPRIFRYALERAACAPEAAVMVGDRLDNDIVPAKRLGMGSIRVLQGLTRAQRPRSQAETPDVTIAAIAELPEALARAYAR